MYFMQDVGMIPRFGFLGFCLENVAAMTSARKAAVAAFYVGLMFPTDLNEAIIPKPTVHKRIIRPWAKWLLRDRGVVLK